MGGKLSKIPTFDTIVLTDEGNQTSSQASKKKEVIDGSL